jgi:glycolate oxidase iron-sulfur subunit
MDAALLPVRVLRRSGAMALLRKTGVMKAFGYLGEMEQLLPKLPPIQQRLNFPERWRARGEKQAAVGMITGCVMQVMQTPVNAATARVLCKSGCDVHAPKAQGCCGALHAHCGDIEKAKELAKHNIEVFEEWQRANGELDAIIINAAGCGAALKEYPGWFKGDEVWENRARAFSQKVKDVSEFLAEPQYKSRLMDLMKGKANSTSKNSQSAARDVLPNTTGATTLKALNQDVEKQQSNQQLTVESTRETTASPSITHRHSPIANRITYHDACHLAHGQGVRAQPRELLALVPNIEIVPLTESEMCCGSAGTYNIAQPEMAMRLLERKMKHIEATGATTVVTGNPGCMMQLLLGAQKFNVPIVIKHPVEVLDEATK